mmetsp:Transcript_25188/g.44132  ORF Transcript_25188/g.44132 Transcript_25188/m.44132 type:complete len:107 (+) Transcript_25188:131-451(+)
MVTMEIMATMATMDADLSRTSAKKTESFSLNFSPEDSTLLLMKKKPLTMETMETTATMVTMEDAVRKSTLPNVNTVTSVTASSRTKTSVDDCSVKWCAVFSAYTYE